MRGPEKVKFYGYSYVYSSEKKNIGVMVVTNTGHKCPVLLHMKHKSLKLENMYYDQKQELLVPNHCSAKRVPILQLNREKNVLDPIKRGVWVLQKEITEDSNQTHYICLDEAGKIARIGETELIQKAHMVDLVNVALVEGKTIRGIDWTIPVVTKTSATKKVEPAAPKVSHSPKEVKVAVEEEKGKKEFIVFAVTIQEILKQGLGITVQLSGGEKLKKWALEYKESFDLKIQKDKQTGGVIVSFNPVAELEPTMLSYFSDGLVINQVNILAYVTDEEAKDIYPGALSCMIGLEDKQYIPVKINSTQQGTNYDRYILDKSNPTLRTVTKLLNNTLEIEKLNQTLMASGQ